MVKQTGLSPPVRGNPPHESSIGPVPGSIPARAGKPEWGFGAVEIIKVYPRPCGETPSALIVT